MTRRILVGLIVASALAATARAQTNRQAEVTLQAALAAEAVELDHAKAIALFDQALKQAGADRAVTAKALLGLGQALERIGKTADAAGRYRRLVEEFPDRPAEASVARARLAALDATASSAIRERDVTATIQGGMRDLSPDGAMVVTQALAGSQARREISLVLRHLESGSVRTLTSLRGPLQIVRYAPDGAWVAAEVRIVDPPEPGVYNEDLVVAPVAPGGAAPHVISASAAAPSDWNLNPPLNRGQLAWSPDSRHLPYIAPAGEGLFDIRLLTVSTGDSRSLGVSIPASNGPADFQWSPDGQQLAIRTRTGDQESVAVVTIADGSVQRIIVESAPGLMTRLGRWTGGGLTLRQYDPAKFEYRRTSQLNPVTGNVRETCRGDEPTTRAGYREPATDLCLDFTPDGSAQLIWRRDSHQHVLHQVATGTDVPLTRAPGDERFGALSPDGRVAVFASNREGWWGLYAVSPDRAPVTNPVLLRRFDGPPDPPRLDWSASSLVAAVRTTTTNIYRIAMDPATGRATGPAERLTNDRGTNLYPAFSPDGRQIVYLGSESERLGLALMNANGTSERLVSRATAPNGLRAVWAPPALANPVWRTDDQILFEAKVDGAAGPTALRQILGLSIDQASPERVTMLPAFDVVEGRGVYHRWTLLRPTDEIAFLVNGPGDQPGRPHTIRARSLKDGTERLLAVMPDADRFLSDFLVSPDGRRVAYLLSSDGACPCELGVFVPATGERTPLLKPNQLQPLGAWSPDSRFLLFGARLPRVIEAVAGSTPWPLVDPPTGPAEVVDLSSWGEDVAASWSPDGASIVIHASGGTSGTWQWLGLDREALSAGGATPDSRDSRSVPFRGRRE